MAFVEFRDVGKTYHMGEVAINALHDATFDVEQGLFFATKGPLLCVIDYCGEIISQQSYDTDAPTDPTSQDPRQHIEVLDTDDESRR